jgi:hypothetical protein
MAENDPPNNYSEKRTEPRKSVSQYHSVEIKLSGSLPIYQFKLRDISPHGVCILIREDSSVLNHLQVGQILNMKYRSEDPTQPTEFLKTEIKHITKAQQGRLKGHYLVGVFILEKSEQPDQDFFNF